MSTLKVDRIYDSSGEPFNAGQYFFNPGKIVKVHHVQCTTPLTVSSLSYVDVPGCTLTVTPEYTNTTFLLVANVHSYTISPSAGQWEGTLFRFMRDSTSILETDIYGIANRSGGSATNYSEKAMMRGTYCYLDEPGTSGHDIIYKLQVKNYYSASSTTRVNYHGSGDFTIYEIFTRIPDIGV